MSESIIDKKLRILGNAQDGSPEVIQAIRDRKWTAQDATEYRLATTGVAGDVKTHAGRVAQTMRRVASSTTPKS